MADDQRPPKDLGEYIERGNPPPTRGVRIPTPPASGKVIPLRPDSKRPTKNDGDKKLSALLGDTLPAGVAAGTDLATAWLLREEHGDDLLYSPTLGWLAWDGKRFAPDDSGEVSRRIQNVGRRLELGAAEMLRHAASVETEAEQKGLRARASTLMTWAKKAQSATGITSATELAQTLLPVRPEELDADPRLFNCQNGTLELIDVEEVPDGQGWTRDAKVVLREHRRSDRITRLCPVEYDPEATAPLFEAFINRILPDTYVREFVQRDLGYALTGSTEEQCFMIAHGSGANGKSVLVDTIRGLLGDYAMTAQASTLMASEHGRGTENDIARLRGARFVTCQETTEGKRLDEARVKQLTGGDVVTARFLFKEHFEFKPEFKLVLACNHRPEIRGADDGIWRRIHLVPFDVTIPPEERDPGLPAKLREELPGILTWLVNGYVWWRRFGGLAPPDHVRAATDSWRGESDDVGRFVAERCTVAKYAKVKCDVMHKAYLTWARDQGICDPLKSNAFSKRLAALKLPGFEQDRTNAEGRIYRGIGLESEPDRWSVQ